MLAVPPAPPSGTRAARSAPAAPLAFERLLPELVRLTGVDLRQYRRPMLERRVRNRMLSVGADSYEEYLQLLLDREDEPARLLERLTIKVSRLYRHKASFDALRALVLPELRARRGGEVRVWSAGCARGEEAYTLGMLLEEAGCPPPSRVLGTDLDERALEVARAGRYPEGACGELPPELRAAHLAPATGGKTPLLEVSEPVRRRVQLARHDLTTASLPEGAPFDLVVCRNVLIYLRGEAQEVALESLCRALEPGSFLFLGETEWPLPSVEALLAPVHRGARLFRRRP